MRTATILCLGLALAACSRPQADRLKHDAQAVGHDVTSDVRAAGDNLDLESAGNELKAAAHDTGVEARRAAQDVREHTRQAGRDTRDAANP
ncbi:MAG: hypothetical protein P4L73_21125 [Caulobacteraceae bacterium]|nr:hypothetical protein [Caulobacteraceae bacterium]